MGMHQGLALSPLLFVIVMEAISFRLQCFDAVGWPAGRAPSL